MSKRDTRRALTRLFADRDDAVMAYALAFLEKEKLRRRIAGLDDELRELKRKARECGARAGDLEAAERAMLQDLDDETTGSDDAGHDTETTGSGSGADMLDAVDSVAGSPVPVPDDVVAVEGPSDGLDGRSAGWPVAEPEPTVAHEDGGF